VERPTVGRRDRHILAYMSCIAYAAIVASSDLVATRV